jgi:4-amino-4-deoxy-L-arabinose transferase-like glycosyltransferase
MMSRLRRPEVGIFVVALVVRLGWVLTRDATVTWDDEAEFIRIAHGLALGQGYVSNSFRANPVLPFLLSLVFRTFGEQLLWARIGQAILGAATCVLVSRIGARLFGASVGVASGLLLALYPPHIYLSGVFYVDAVLSFVLAFAVWCVTVLLDGPPSPRRALGCGAVLGVTVLTRPLFAVYCPCVCLLILLRARGAVRARVMEGGALLCGVLLVVLPWTLRNAVTFGRLVPVSSGFHTHLWQGNNELSVGDPDDRYLIWSSPIWKARLAAQDAGTRATITERYASMDERVDRAITDNGGDWHLAVDDVLGPLAIQQITLHPIRTLRLATRKIITLYSAFSNTQSANRDVSLLNRALAALAFYPILALAVLGGVMAVWAHRPVGVVISLIGSATLMYALLTACTRFRLPLDPFLIVLAGYPIARIMDRTCRDARTAVPAATPRGGGER